MPACCACWTRRETVVDLPPPVVPRTAVWRGQNRLLVRRHADDNMLVANDEAETHVAVGLEDGGGLGVVEGKHGAVRQRAEPGRGQGAVAQLLAQDRDLDRP